MVKEGIKWFLRESFGILVKIKTSLHVRVIAFGAWRLIS